MRMTAHNNRYHPIYTTRFVVDYPIYRHCGVWKRVVMSDFCSFAEI